MIGRHILDLPGIHKKYNIVPLTRNNCDLTVEHWTRNKFAHERPDLVVHLAGYNGGIEFNRKYPDIIFERTTKMAINTLQSCKEYGVKKVVSVLASCSYPDGKSTEPLKEEDLWNGGPNPSVECHGLAKRILHAYSLQLRKVGLPAVCAILNNSFGPHDRFCHERGKVVSALIRRFVEAKLNGLESVSCWGTGAPLREFIYAADAAACLIQVLENYDESSPINISSGQEVSIRELTESIVAITGYTGEVVWDTTKPDGQMRKALDLTKMGNYVTHQMTNMEQALTTTVKWYENNREKANARV